MVASSRTHESLLLGAEPLANAFALRVDNLEREED